MIELRVLARVASRTGGRRRGEAAVVAENGRRERGIGRERKKRKPTREI